MKIGAICSGNAGTFLSAMEIFLSLDLVQRDEIKILFDFECVREDIAFTKENYIYKSKEDFSAYCKEAFNCFDLVILYTVKMMASVFIDSVPSINIHPSLLPAFKGIGALEKSFEAKTKFLGVTAHIPTLDFDSGPIIAQTLMPTSQLKTVEEFKQASFLQKVYITILCVEYMKMNNLKINPKEKQFFFTQQVANTLTSNPSILSEKLLEKFKEFQIKECGKQIVF